MSTNTNKAQVMVVTVDGTTLTSSVWVEKARITGVLRYLSTLWWVSEAYIINPNNS